EFAVWEMAARPLLREEPSGTRCKYVRVRLTAASLLQTVPEGSSRISGLLVSCPQNHPGNNERDSPSAFSSPVRKVFQQLQARPGAFFRVELHCKDVISRHRGRQVDSVPGAAGQVGVAFRFGVVAVYEVETVAVRDVVPEWMVYGVVHLVPAHVRHFQAFAVFSEVVAEVAD